jgi:hypothetical protein
MIGEEVHLTPPPNDGSPNPLPTTQQQSIPKTPAVAPALAGRASSNSSVAVHSQIPSRLCLMGSLVVLLFLCAGHLIKSLLDL